MTSTACSKVMRYSWIIGVICIQFTIGSPEPLVSSSGMMPMHGNPPAAEVAQEPKQVEPEKPASAPLVKRQDAKGYDLTDQQMNLLLSSFPNDEGTANTEAPALFTNIPVPTAPIIIVSKHPTPVPSKTYYYNQQPEAASSPTSFSSPIIRIENPIVQGEGHPNVGNKTSIHFVDSFVANPKPDDLGRTIWVDPPAPKVTVEMTKVRPDPLEKEVGPHVIDKDKVRTDALEKEIVSQSMKEDINRQVIDQASKQTQQSIDNNLIQREASKAKTLAPPASPSSSGKNDAVEIEGDEGENDPLFEHQKDLSTKKRTSNIPMYKPGAPWNDEKIVGKLLDDMAWPPTEVSHKTAIKLCAARKRVADKPPFAGRPTRYFLWAPINQYVPLIHKGYPIRPPLFAPQCLKWVLRPCRGVLRQPLVKPCTYWAPMPIRRPECGFVPNVRTKLVNYRPPSFIPGHCPCVWPCTKRFDPIQRCRVETPEAERQMDSIHSDGDPWHEGEIRIQELLAAQLCRGMKLAMTTRQVVPIGWLPMRIESIVQSSDPEEAVQKLEVGEVESQFRRRKRSIDSFTRKSKRQSKKRRQVVDKKKFYNPDAVLEPDNGLKGRSEKDSMEDDLETEGENEGVLGGFAEMSSYDPDKYRVKPEEETNFTYPTCIEWRYKACPKGHSSEELHLYKLEEEGKKEPEGEGKQGLNRRSTNRHKRRRVHKRNGAGAAGPFSVASVHHTRTSEGHGKIHKRHDENTDDDAVSNNNLGILSGTPSLGCGEWHYTESTHCVLEERVGMSARFSRIMITGVIDSDEEDEDDDDLMDEVKKVDSKTFRNLCPGTNGRFPCFLKRRKRDANETVDAAEGNSTMPEEEPEQEEPLENHDSEERKIMAEEQKAKEEVEEEVPEVKGLEEKSAGIVYDNQIQMLPDSACMCDWPCLPFFDKINRCYDQRGNTIDAKGKYIFRSFRRAQRSPVACINFVETDEIYCKVKDKHE